MFIRNALAIKFILIIEIMLAIRIIWINKLFIIMGQFYGKLFISIKIPDGDVIEHHDGDVDGESY